MKFNIPAVPRRESGDRETMTGMKGPASERENDAMEARIYQAIKISGSNNFQTLRKRGPRGQRAGRLMLRLEYHGCHPHVCSK
jgi:hypothetical protein